MDFQEMLRNKYAQDIERAKTYEMIGRQKVFNTINGDVEVYLYGNNTDRVIINFHGGGYAFGHPAFNDLMSDAIANKTDGTVVSVNYTKSVVEKFPRAFDDSFGVVDFVIKNHPNSKIILLGQSAGAQLATSSAIKGFENDLNIYSQILVYPSIDRKTDPYKKYDPQFAPFADAFAKLYCEKAEDLDSVYVSPYYATDKQLREFKNVLIITAENDALRPEGEDYYNRIKDLYSNNKYICIEDTMHGFFEDGMDKRNIESAMGKLPYNVSEKANECLEIIVNYIKNLK